MLLPRPSPGPLPATPVSVRLFRRQGPTPTPTPSPQNDPNNNANPGKLIIVSVSILCGVGSIIILYTLLRVLRSRYPTPRYIPTSFLKRRWRSWAPGSSHQYDSIANMHVPPRRRRGLTNDSLSANPPTRQTSTNAPAPDRNTSVRSVITLPAYKPSPSESEQTLGREGERGGIDVVVSFPESAAEIEDRRNTEMESLYQIRATRRAEGLAREDRRERRRVARAAGDNDALEQIRRERDAARAASSGPGDSTSSLAAQVLAENAQRERERRISSVSYASIGLAIHDGSRVRASSTESERPLLGVEDGGRPNPSFLGGHTRGRSGSSALSVSTLASAEHSPSPVRGRGDSRVTLETINLGGRDRAGSAGTYGTTQDGESGDVADVGFPTEAPPGYEGASWNGRPAPGDGEEAPPYESPVRARAPPLPLVSPNGAPQLPALGRLPEIEITTHEQVGSR